MSPSKEVTKALESLQSEIKDTFPSRSMYRVTEYRPGFVDSSEPLRESLVDSPEAVLEVPWLKEKGVEHVRRAGPYLKVFARGFVVAIVSHG